MEKNFFWFLTKNESCKDIFPEGKQGFFPLLLGGGGKNPMFLPPPFSLNLNFTRNVVKRKVLDKKKNIYENKNLIWYSIKFIKDTSHMVDLCASNIKDKGICLVFVPSSSTKQMDVIWNNYWRGITFRILSFWNSLLCYFASTSITIE